MNNERYEKKIIQFKKKLANLEKFLTSEKKELSKQQKNLMSAKQRARVAQKKSRESNKKTISEHAKLAIQKETKLVRSFGQQKAKVKKLKEAIHESKNDIRELEKQKRLYSSAMNKFEKQWNQYYLKPTKASQIDEIEASQKIDFSIQVRTARALLNLSINEFSEKLGITPAVLKQIEQPGAKTLFEKKLVKDVYKKLKQCGIEVISQGFYIGDGGVGVRFKNAAPQVRVKTKKYKKTADVLPLKHRKPKPAGAKRRTKVA